MIEATKDSLAAYPVAGRNGYANGGAVISSCSAATIEQTNMWFTFTRKSFPPTTLITVQMFGIFQPEVFAPMVFCKECQQKVDECPHFVDPIQAPRIPVFDQKIEALAYSEQDRILEISYKSGQVWQLFGVPHSIYGELRDTTLTSFVKFIAQRYRVAPVKTGLKAIRVPGFEKCSKCGANMNVRHRVDNRDEIKIRILWECSACDHTGWKQYESGKQQVARGHGV